MALLLIRLHTIYSQDDGIVELHVRNALSLAVLEGVVVSQELHVPHLPALREELVDRPLVGLRLQALHDDGAVVLPRVVPLLRRCCGFVVPERYLLRRFDP